MKIYLHIGIEKTGSTTIQGFLTLNRELLQQRGVAISNALGAGNNVLLAAYAMNHDRSNSIHVQQNAVTPDARHDFDSVVTEDFLHETSSLSLATHSIVLSNEHCHSNLIDREEIEKLRGLLRKVSNDITIVVYLRRQIDVCISHYSTLLKLGYETDFNEHISSLSLTHFYNYFELLNLWSGVFGKDKVKVRIFDRSKLVGGDLIEDFCDAIDLRENSDFEVPPKLNESLVPEAQDYLLQLNRFRSAHPIKSIEEMHERLKSQLEMDYSGRGHTPSVEFAAQKQSLFEASNAELNAKYFGESHVLFSELFDEFSN